MISIGNIKQFKVSFWTIHISGWLAFMAVDLVINYYKFNNVTDFLIWFDSDIMGFITISILRYYYRRVFKYKKKIINQFSIILIASLAGGVVWFFLRGFSHLLFFNSLVINFRNYYHVFTEPYGLPASIFWLVAPVLGWSLAYIGIKYYLSLIEEMNKSHEMEIQAKNAQLKMLRYQINPHFLFNSLNSIQGLMYKDTDRADLMLTELSDFLRSALLTESEIFIALKDEFETVNKYLFIEKIRFDERLNYKIRLPERLSGCKVLCFLTQPFVENAIKHGMKSNPYGMMDINIIVSRIKDHLFIRISNTGGWIDNDEKSGTGIFNARERLSTAYNDNFDLAFIKEVAMVNVVIKIPYHE